MFLAAETPGNGLCKDASKCRFVPRACLSAKKSPQRGSVLHVLLQPPSVCWIELSSQRRWLLLSPDTVSISGSHVARGKVLILRTDCAGGFPKGVRVELDLLKQVALAAGAHMNVRMALCRRLEEKGQLSVCSWRARWRDRMTLKTAPRAG